MTGIPSHWKSFYSINKNAVILITNKDYYVIECLKLENSVFVTLTVTNEKLFIGSQYTRPHPNGDLDKDIQDWTDYFNNFSDVIVGGDFNTPLLQLGYTRETERSEILLEHLVHKDMFILNDPDAPETFEQGNLKGRPDLTIGGINIVQQLSGWTVNNTHISFSDHKYIHFSLSFTPILRYNKRYKTKNKNFNRFNRLIEKNYINWMKELLKIMNIHDLDCWMQNFESNLLDIMKRNFRLGTLSYKPSSTWFTSELRIERNRLNAIYKRSIKNPEENHYRELYKIARNKYKKSVKYAKRKSWQSFCSNTENAFGNLFKFISGKNIKHTDLIFTVLEDSAPMASYDDVAMQLMKEHFDINSGVNSSGSHYSNYIYNLDPDFVEITYREIKHALSKQALNKAPGPDGIDAIVIKNLIQKFPALIRAIFNRCLMLGHFPKPWKRGMVIYFCKRNKNPKLSKAYRPITLLNILAKIYERILKTRIMTVLESTSFLNDNQHGFRESRSTVTALKFLKHTIQTNLKNFKYCSIVSIDIQGAFDNVDWDVLFSIIDSLPLNNYLKSSLKSYITDRLIGFSFSDGVKWFSLNRGCPQGSCVGPLLWLLVADVILKRISQIHGNILSYADDFILIFSANTRNSLETQTNSILQNFTNITDILNLTISPSKSQGMLFGRFTLPNRHPIFKINNTSIPIVDNIKYLGLTLDSKFNWIAHFELLRENIRNFAFIVNKTSTRDRGLSTTIRKIWYLTVIEKRISYGHEIWYQDLRTHASRKLNSCQRIGLFSIIKPYRTTSTDAMCILTGVIPILIKLGNSSLLYSTVHDNNKLNINGTEISKSNIMHKVNTFDFPHYNKIKNLNFIAPTKISVDNSIFPQIYTDGSKMDEGTAAAFTVFYHGNYILDYTIRLHPNNSIYQAELVAILKALEWVITTNFDNITIYTDSLSSVFTLQRAFPSNIISLNIFNILYNNSSLVVNIGWIKAHMGLEGNERADRLAKSVILDNLFDTVLDIPFPISYVKYHLNKISLKEWQTNWELSTKGRDTYNIIRHVNTDFICNTQISLYYATGHGSFPAYLYKINKRPDNNCICGREGTVVHYIYGNCPLMKFHFSFNNRYTLRYNLFSVIFDNNNYHKLKENYNILIKNYSFIKYTF